jgi:hypothetical protein
MAPRVHESSFRILFSAELVTARSITLEMELVKQEAGRIAGVT